MNNTEYPSGKIALIDMDGTIAAYSEGMAEEMAKLSSPGEPDYGLQYDDDVPKYIEARRKLVKRRPGFWRNLKPLALGFDLVGAVRRIGFEMHVLTKGPSSVPSAWSEKLEWCRHYIPDALVTVTEEKSLVYGRVLLDDYPPYFQKWLRYRPRGIVIAVAQPWNEGFDNGDNVIRYTGSNLNEVEDRLQAAFDRDPGA